jgi:hypothetical protein
MPKLIKIRDEWQEKDILINIEDISVIEVDHKNIIMNNTSRMYSRISTNKKGIDDVCEACGYYETPSRQVEGKLFRPQSDIWGCDSEGTQWSSPREITDEDIYNPGLVLGVCKCKLTTRYTHVFKKSEHPNGRIDFKCVFCGEGGQLIFNPSSSDS